MRHWLCAGREAQIPEPGDFFVREPDPRSSSYEVPSGFAIGGSDIGRGVL